MDGPEVLWCQTSEKTTFHWRRRLSYSWLVAAAEGRLRWSVLEGGHRDRILVVQAPIAIIERLLQVDYLVSR
jgi:hypothetical protein